MGTVLEDLISDYTQQLEAKDSSGLYDINDARSLSEFINTIKNGLLEHPS